MFRIIIRSCVFALWCAAAQAEAADSIQNYSYEEILADSTLSERALNFKPTEYHDVVWKLKFMLTKVDRHNAKLRTIHDKLVALVAAEAAQIEANRQIIDNYKEQIVKEENAMNSLISDAKSLNAWILSYNTSRE